MNFSAKHIIIIILLIFSTINLPAQETNTQKFGKGVDLYTAAKYEDALKEWLDVYNTGYRSAFLDYNIGNAYFKLENIPGAILFYERALLLKPGDENTHYNLQIARTLVVDKFDAIPELFFVRWFDFVSLLLPANSWGILSILSFVLSLVLLSVYIYSSHYKIKVIGFWAAILFLILSASSLAFTLRNKSLVYDNQNAVIFAPSVNGKSSPDASGTDLFVLHEGSKVSIEDEVGNWYEIKLSDGNKGWVPTDALEII